MGAPEPQRRSSVYSSTGKIWHWPDLVVRTPVDAPGRPPWVEAFLARRGVTDLDGYFDLSLQSMADPVSMAGMDAAVDRLGAAIAKGEPITVWGDYDVDGVSGTTVLVDFLRQVGATQGLSYYIPHRRSEGYGLNREGIDTIIPRGGVLVTVDCGSTAYAEIAHAKAAGLDVIVVDHHRVDQVSPDALACINPQRVDCGFPFKGLCATGVAFMLVVALRRALRERGMFGQGGQPDVRQLLDVVALATVADMVPMTGLNRVLVAAGLRRLATAPRVGLEALMAVSKVDPARVSASDLGFRLGPRINARGRLAHAEGAVELMLTHDRQRAEALATSLDHANRERREVERHTVEAAKAEVERAGLLDHHALVVGDPAWHPGVLGLVASRLVAAYHRPTVVIGEGGKGSARTAGDIDLHAAIATQQELLVRFGGHKAAAGLTIEWDRVEAFRAGLGAAVHAHAGPAPYIPELCPDMEVDASFATLATAATLEGLGPFGMAHREPLLAARGLRVRQARVVGDTHLKLAFEGDTPLGPRRVDAIGFGLGHLHQELPEAVDAVFTLERNVFQGRETPQLALEDLRPAED